MEQTMTIKGRKRVSREEIIKVQEKLSRITRVFMDAHKIGS